MNRKEQTPGIAAGLRKSAEIKAGKAFVESAKPLTLEESSRRMVYELQVHQIELEMQNEELRQAQAELEASRARYFDLYDLAPIGYCTLDEKNTIVEANLRIANMLGETRISLVKQPFISFIFPQDQDIFSAFRQTFFKQLNHDSGPSTVKNACELRLVKKDKSVFWAQLIMSGLQKKDDICLNRLVVTDITERKHIEYELHEARNELARIVQVQRTVISSTQNDLEYEAKGRKAAESENFHRQDALEAVYVMETAFDSNIDSAYDQIVLSVSATLKVPSAAVYEYREGKIIRGSIFSDGHVSKDIAIVQACAACQNVLQDMQPTQCFGDLGLKFSNNLCFDPLRYKSYLGVPIIGPKAIPYGVIVVLDEKERIFTDYEIKFVEIFSRYLANDLARRDLELRLHRANEMRLLGNLTSGVAHEVRNPLNGILAIMGALSKEFSHISALQPFVYHMESQVTRLRILMDDLLELGRPIREENMQEISLVKIVGSAIATWLETIKDKPREILYHQENDQENFIVKVEVPRVTQIIINLLENANDHSQADIPVSVSICKKPNGFVSLVIKDCGSGIPPEILPRIFEPFFTTRKGGTGLGLSIVRHIVENHNGTVAVHNNSDGPGATFEVDFPVYVKE